MSKFIIVQTTIKKEDSDSFIQKVFKKGYTFCVHSYDISSRYFWDGKICKDLEVAVLFKAKKKDYKKLCKCIKKNHSYETPEILVFNIKKIGKQYKKWGVKSLKVFKTLK